MAESGGSHPKNKIGWSFETGFRCADGRIVYAKRNRGICGESLVFWKIASQKNRFSEFNLQRNPNDTHHSFRDFRVAVFQCQVRDHYNNNGWNSFWCTYDIGLDFIFHQKNQYQRLFGWKTDSQNQRNSETHPSEKHFVSDWSLFGFFASILFPIFNFRCGNSVLFVNGSHYECLFFSVLFTNVSVFGFCGERKCGGLFLRIVGGERMDCGVHQYADVVFKCCDSGGYRKLFCFKF